MADDYTKNLYYMNTANSGVKPLLHIYLSIQLKSYHVLRDYHNASNINNIDSNFDS